jgi:hypothetical protein
MKKKAVVFDVDQTLGDFTQFSIFGHVIEDYFGKPDIIYRYFNDLVDLYPEIIRPNMVRILDYIRKKKDANVCSKVMIYTNNMGPDKWVGHIRQYFEQKLRTLSGSSLSSHMKNGLVIMPPLFDHTIGGFKPNQESTSSSSRYPQRTTSHKTVNELIRCGRLPSEIEICFLDDIEHPKMVDERVYYIKLQPYHSYISFELFVVRFLNSALFRDVFDKFHVPSITPGMSSSSKKQILSIEIHNLFMKYAKLSEYDAREVQRKLNPREIDEIISKYILYNLQQFFREGPPVRGLKASSTSRRRNTKTSKKNTSSRSHSPAPTNTIFYVDKNTSVKNMRNKTLRNR